MSDRDVSVSDCDVSVSNCDVSVSARDVSVSARDVSVSDRDVSVLGCGCAEDVLTAIGTYNVMYCTWFDVAAGLRQGPVNRLMLLQAYDKDLDHVRSWLAEKEKTVEALVTLPMKSADLHHLMEDQRVCSSCRNTIHVVAVYSDCTYGLSIHSH